MDQQPQNQPPSNPPQPEGPTPPQSAAPSETMSSETPPTEQEPVTAPAAPASVKEPAVDSSNRPNRLAALMLTASFGYYGLHQLYIGNKTQGFVRLGLAILALPLMFVFIGLLIVPVLGAWAIYDFVRIGFGAAKDSQGKELVASERDATWAKTLTIVALVLFGVYVAFFLLLLSLGVLDVINEGVNGASTTTETFSPTIQDY